MLNFLSRFIAKVFVGKEFICEKTGKSKKLAKLNAVTEAIEILDVEGKVKKTPNFFRFSTLKIWTHFTFNIG